MTWDEFLELKNLFALIYIIPSYFLYFLIFYIMFISPAKTKFHGSFYKLFGCSAVNYLAQSISFWLLFRFPYLEPFFYFLKYCPKTSGIYIFVYILTYYSATALHLYSVALSFNRFTVFILLAKYKNFWRKNLKYILGFCIFAPFLAVWHIPFIGVECHFDNDWGALTIAYNEAAFPWFQSAQILFIEILVTSVISLAMNLYVIFQLINRRNNSDLNNSQISNHDKKMLIYSMLIFSTEFLSCFQQLLLTFWKATFQSFVSSTQFVLADVSTLAPAWFILFTNKQLRQEIMNLLFCQTSINTVNIPSIQTLVSSNIS